MLYKEKIFRKKYGTWGEMSVLSTLGRFAERPSHAVPFWPPLGTNSTRTKENNVQARKGLIGWN